MAEAASAQQAASATAEDTSHQRAGRRRRTSAEPQRAQHGAPAAATPAALDSLSRLQQLADASPQAAQLQRLQALADASPQAAQLRRLQALADAHHSPVSQLAGAPEEEGLVQGQFANAELPPQLQQAPRANNTGLPDQLKSGIESLSGLSMDHVRVHYNSSQPAQRQEIHTAFGQVATPAQMPPTATGMPDPLKADTESLSPQGRVRATTQMEENASAFSGPADRPPIQRVRFLSVKRVAQQGSLYEGIGVAGPPALAHNGGLTWWGPRATAMTYAAGGGSMWRSTAANALNLVDMSAPEKLGKTMRETIRRTNNNLSPALQGVLQNHDFAYAVPHAVAQTAQMCLDYANAQFANQNGQWTANPYVLQVDVDNALQLAQTANEIPLWVGSVIQNFADHGSPNALQLDDANFLASPDNYVVLRKDATNLDAGFADALLADLYQPNMAGEFHGLHVPAGMKFGGFTNTKHEILIRNSPANLTQPVAPQGTDPDLQVSDKTLGVDDSLLARAWRWFGLNN